MDEKVHAVRLMGKPMEWAIVCTETLPKKGQVYVGIAYVEKITCEECLRIVEERLQMIRETIMPRIMEIPWVQEAIEDGVFKDEGV